MFILSRSQIHHCTPFRHVVIRGEEQNAPRRKLYYHNRHRTTCTHSNQQFHSTLWDAGLGFVAYLLLSVPAALSASSMAFSAIHHRDLRLRLSQTLPVHDHFLHESLLHGQHSPQCQLSHDQLPHMHVPHILPTYIEQHSQIQLVNEQLPHTHLSSGQQEPLQSSLFMESPFMACQKGVESGEDKGVGRGGGCCGSADLERVERGQEVEKRTCSGDMQGDVSRGDLSISHRGATSSSSSSSSSSFMAKLQLLLKRPSVWRLLLQCFACGYGTGIMGTFLYLVNLLISSDPRHPSRPSLVTRISHRAKPLSSAEHHFIFA
jgi:hypothetical protein